MSDSIFDRPDVVFHITGRHLKELAALLLQSIEEKTIVKKPAEMCTRQVKQHLLEKGFHCKSDPGFIALVKQLNLARVKRGKEFWYKTEEIEAIPSRLLEKRKR